ncbi:HigA family addiction module antitoxin [Diaminobutyricibacter sp. McL0608]|uniref:HigA family addiction module antitoxin n=1 Tax=Leifsonia sp. McL0608 TaxID=3143537 RepID=UPI0031F2E753
MDRTLLEAVPPGEILADELQAREWSQAEFAEILGRPTQFVSEIVSGKKEITRESAAQIGAALGTSPELWLDMQNAYLLHKQAQSAATQRQLEEVRRRARLNSLAPISVLRRRGLIAGDTLDDLEASLRDLLEVQSLDEEPVFLAAARRSNDDVPLTPTQLAWLAAARKRARRMQVDQYNKKLAQLLAQEVASIVREPRAFSDLPSVFAEAGVRLVYVEALPSSKMNGATFLLDEDMSKPVIALSGRGKRLDVVLFTLLHELAHLIRGDVRPGEMVIDEEAHTLGDEDAANDIASRWAIPGGLPSPDGPVRSQWIAEHARNAKVHPIVVVGQLQNRGDLDWRTQLAKGAPTVTAELNEWNEVSITSN